MFKERKTIQLALISLALFLTILLIGTTTVFAQYWSAMPPYNLLWPLWSPALSPIDATTGIATPLLSQVTNSSILPVQPVMLWDPSQQFPWLLYNIPPLLGGGLTYFDPYYGLNPWPPSYLNDPLTGLPSPIGLPLGYDLLPPTELSAFGPSVSQSNLYFALQYPAAQFGVSLSSLLTAAQIWGLPIF